MILSITTVREFEPRWLLPACDVFSLCSFVVSAFFGKDSTYN